jgi:hypothetical protein
LLPKLKFVQDFKKQLIKEKLKLVLKLKVELNLLEVHPPSVPD